MSGRSSTGRKMCRTLHRRTLNWDRVNLLRILCNRETLLLMKVEISRLLIKLKLLLLEVTSHPLQLLQEVVASDSTKRTLSIDRASPPPTSLQQSDPVASPSSVTWELSAWKHLFSVLSREELSREHQNPFKAKSITRKCSSKPEPENLQNTSGQD